MTKRHLYKDAPFSDDVEVVAIFGQTMRVDRDFDVIMPGAVKYTQVVISDWAHTSWGSRLPIGKGVVRIEDRELTLRGQLFAKTKQGRNTIGTLKGLGDLADWSFGYQVKRSHHGTHDGKPVRFLDELEVFECSPVLRGSAADSRTVHLGTKDSRRAVEWKTTAKSEPTRPSTLMEVMELAGAIEPSAQDAAIRTLGLALDDLGLKDEDIGVRFWLSPKGFPGADTVAVPTVSDTPVEKLAGFAPRTGSDVWVRANLSPRESATTIAHELRHLWQRANRVDESEQDAEAFGERIAGQVLG